MKWTLITGSAKGLGRACALHLARLGYPLVLHYRKSQAEAAELKRACLSLGANVELLQGDFTDSSTTLEFVKTYLRKYPKTKNLINNIGNYYLGTTLNTPYTVWEEIFFTNLHVPFLLSKALASSIIEEKGSILNIGVAGLQNKSADLYSSAYTMAKGALRQFTASLAKELAPSQVRVNMVSPGYLENSIDLTADVEIPIGKPTSLEEAANLIAYLLDDNNNTITGQNIEIAGGVRL